MTPKKLNILLLFDVPWTPKPDQDFSEELKTDDWKTEAHILEALKKLGHDVRYIPVHNDISPIIETIKNNKPDIVFNLVEEFNHKSFQERNIPSLLELLGIPYTGTGPVGMMLCKNKALTKQIMSHRRIKNARFAVFPPDKKITKPHDLSYPIIIKPVTDDASYGISQASFVEKDEDFTDRIRFIHENRKQWALAEEYIEGRELYVSILGNRRLKILPVREMKFRAVPKDEPRIATFKAKWDNEYRKRWGINEEFADPLPNGSLKKIETLAKRTYRALRIKGYGRLDMRLTPEGDAVVMEANPNPFLATDEDFAESAQKAGLSYETLIQRLLMLGLQKE